jgi:hypothetical protein
MSIQFSRRAVLAAGLAATSPALFAQAQDAGGPATCNAGGRAPTCPDGVMVEAYCISVSSAMSCNSAPQL